MIPRTAELKYTNDWYKLWEDLEKTDASGATYSYYVEEVNGPDGFTVTYSNNDGIQSGTITVKNTKLEKTDFEFDKIWLAMTAGPAAVSSDDLQTWPTGKIRHLN